MAHTVTGIVTPRLLLRPPAARDFEAWARFHADPLTMEHLGGVQHEADAWRSLAALIGAWQLRPAALGKLPVRVWGQSRESWLARRAAFDALVPRTD